MLRDPTSVAIAESVLDDEDPELVVSGLRLIRDVGSSESARVVRPLLDHPVFFVRSEAATVLGRIGDASDAERIAGQMDSDSPWIAIRSARALAQLGDTEALAGLAGQDGLAGEAAREVLQGSAA